MVRLYLVDANSEPVAGARVEWFVNGKPFATTKDSRSVDTCHVGPDVATPLQVDIAYRATIAGDKRMTEHRLLGSGAFTHKFAVDVHAHKQGWARFLIYFVSTFGFGFLPIIVLLGMREQWNFTTVFSSSADWCVYTIAVWAAICAEIAHERRINAGHVALVLVGMFLGAIPAAYLFVELTDPHTASTNMTHASVGFAAFATICALAVKLPVVRATLSG